MFHKKRILLKINQLLGTISSSPVI